MESLEELKQIIGIYGNMCVAYSGGADSTFLLYVAKEVLRDKVMAVLIDSPVLSRRDRESAENVLKEAGVKYEIVEGDPFAVGEFRKNTRMRCYHCKKNNYRMIMDIAGKNGFTIVADGQNSDDMVAEDRPGHKAAQELGVVSPLGMAGISKADVRRYSKIMGVPTWDKPSNACLATRIPFDTEINRDKLGLVEKAEDILRDMVSECCRARWHGDIVRIEVPAGYFAAVSGDKTIVAALKELGFKYVVLDLEGFRSGSMN